MPNIAINGFGRIGSLSARAILQNQKKLNIVAVNDLASKTALLKNFYRDPVYGGFSRRLTARFFQEKNPAKLPWAKLGVDVVLECSGFFTDFEGASQHIQAGAKKVIISAPASAPAGAAAGKPASNDSPARMTCVSVSGGRSNAGKPAIPTYLLGVNFEKYKGEKIISMGSCTTNATAPVLKILDEKFGIKKCFLNTTHSYTASQNKLYPNWQKISGSQLSIIPSSTGASKTIEKVLPELAGKIAGVSLRVPTATVSIVDLVCLLKKSADVQAINRAIKIAAQTNSLKGILGFAEGKKNSADFLRNSFSGIVDLTLTQAMGDMARVLVWYDNEWAYACRLSELAPLILTSNF